MRSLSICCWLILSGSLSGFGKSPAPDRMSASSVYTGSTGASAGAAVDSDLFIVADDEANQLRVYRRHEPGPPVQAFDLTDRLELDRHAPETDLEGAARMGDRVYWISSHSRNHLGKAHANRYRFFATSLKATNGVVQLVMIGRPYKSLLQDLLRSPELRSLPLAEAASLPPKERGALNIEGLSATPDGQLLIGFRNPIPGGKAVIVPLSNPSDLLEGRPAKFGAPILLDLDGLGIRDFGYWAGTYVIIAGPYDSGGRSKLYLWSGPGATPRHVKDVDLKGFNAEAVIIYPDKGLSEVQLLSDDSSHQRSGGPHSGRAEAERHFRSVWVDLEPKHHKGGGKNRLGRIPSDWAVSFGDQDAPGAAADLSR